MFFKKKKNNYKITNNTNKINTIIGNGSSFNGTLKIIGGIRIDGNFEGNLEVSDELIIGKSGVVKADVRTKNATIGGKVTGNINATGKVELRTGSSLTGDIKTSSLIIDDGVLFNGNCNMLISGKEEVKSGQ